VTDWWVQPSSTIAGVLVGSALTWWIQKGVLARQRAVQERERHRIACKNYLVAVETAENYISNYLALFRTRRLTRWIDAPIMLGYLGKTGVTHELHTSVRQYITHIVELRAEADDRVQEIANEITEVLQDASQKAISRPVPKDEWDEFHRRMGELKSAFVEAAGLRTA
jgi:hypothetical protein